MEPCDIHGSTKQNRPGNASQLAPNNGMTFGWSSWRQVTSSRQKSIFSFTMSDFSLWRRTRKHMSWPFTEARWTSWKAIRGLQERSEMGAYTVSAKCDIFHAWITILFSLNTSGCRPEKKGRRNYTSFCEQSQTFLGRKKIIICGAFCNLRGQSC